tara:strand:+ start:201 stop:458 length:258 start_codon:yes stop_codon:yes gene_type:complete
MRTTIKDLENKIDYLNRVTDNRYDFTLESCYGAYKLASHKGSVDALPCGLVSKKELYLNICSFIEGFRLIEHFLNVKDDYECGRV